MHVACQPDANFADGCESAKEIDLDETLQQIIIERHNLKRSQVSTGKLAGFPTASNMLEMVGILYIKCFKKAYISFELKSWDPELSHIAGFNVRTCKMKHDACRSTFAFPNAGQNLAKMSAYGTFSDPKAMLITMIDDLWFGEHKDTPVEMVKEYKAYDKVIGHFTAMIQQKSARVGCAMTQFKENDKWYVTLLACNYSWTNFYGAEIYAEGIPCSKCALKCSSNYPGLCIGQ